MELRANKDRLNVAFLSANKTAYSETFITAQLTQLPHNCIHYFGGVPPRTQGDLKLSATLVQRLWSKVFRKKGSDWLLDNLSRSFIKNNIDVILAQFGPMAAAVAPVADDLALPLVAHFHGADAYVKKHHEPYGNYAELFRIARRILVVSDDMRRQLLNLGAPEDRLITTCYGPRSEFFRIKHHERSTRFLSVGRFVEKKAPYFTIMAFSQIVREFPDAQLTMVGDGPLLGMCKRLVNYYGLQEKVQFTGALSHLEVCELMGRSFCFVQHSLTADDGDKEGSPVAIVEAAAASLPIVATRHAGISFTVIDSVTGYLVDEGDVDQMAARMKELCADQEKARVLGETGRAHIAQNASLEKYISDVHCAIISAYNQ